MIIELNADELDTLQLMSGYATGAAMKFGERGLAFSFVRLINRMNVNNPDWTPYEVPDEEEMDL